MSFLVSLACFIETSAQHQHTSTNISFITPHSSHLTPRLPTTHYAPCALDLQTSNLRHKISHLTHHNSHFSLYASHLLLVISTLYIPCQTESFVCSWGVMLTMLPDFGKLQERSSVREMARNKLTHVMFLIQQCYIVCAFHRRSMPSSLHHLDVACLLQC